jgi:hypothetical protein
MAYFLNTAVSCCQVISEVSQHCFQHIFGLQIHCGLDCHSLDFYLNYFSNTFGLQDLDDAELMKYAVTTLFGAKKFFHSEIQKQ